jgi:5-(carboxyamino)imidazole ribonucleotide synthase
LRIGIIGGGQLGKMMIMEGLKLDFQFSVIDSSRDSPAGRIAGNSYSYEEYREFVNESDVITFEFEHVNEEVLDAADKSGKLMPGINSIILKRDRAREKQFLIDIRVPTAPFEVAEDRKSLNEAVSKFSESVVKSAFGGYDGKGQYRIARGQSTGGIPEGKYVVEEKINFDYEASIIAVGCRDGSVKLFQPSFNLNERGILLLNRAPIEVNSLGKIAETIIRELKYVGAMGIEFFIKDGKPMVNEIAPRVHNTGHHTLVGSSLSQFEAHLRAICGLPLHNPRTFIHSGIVNLIGRGMNPSIMEQILKIRDSQIYWYGKEGVRKGRKMGHVNLTAATEEELIKKIDSVIDVYYGKNRNSFI